MKKHTFFTMLCVLLVLTGCQKQQEQTDIRLPEAESPVTEETITEPSEKPEEALTEESSAEPEQESVAPDLGNFEELLEVLQTLQTRKDWKKQPGIRDDYGTKGEGTQPSAWYAGWRENK